MSGKADERSAGQQPDTSITRHNPTVMYYTGSHYHKRSTQRGSSWTDQYVCPVCGRSINRIANIFKGKREPICVGPSRKGRDHRKDDIDLEYEHKEKFA